MQVFRSGLNWLRIAILLAVCAAYSNHFHNSFHFDDSHTVIDNPYIRSLANLPRFFTDATTFSVLPANRTYRPFVSASLALDYALGHGYNLFWFHLSTFLIFLLQLAAMDALFTAILNATRPGGEAAAANRYISLLAVAWYGLHPAMAETVNYIIQRGDIYSTIGVVAALALYARLPNLRKFGLYLIPLAFALLSKPPAVVFPLLLFLYLAMFERKNGDKLSNIALATLPSIAVCVVLMELQSAMTPKTFFPSSISTYSYCITQPFVLMRYFGSLFLPLHLNVDTDLQAFPAFNLQAFAGFAFVALILTAAWFTFKRRELRPISYGLLWFVIASLPTSLYRLSEVENDHRMYLPFVGLVLAVTWAAYLSLQRLAAGRNGKHVWRAAYAATVVLLALYAYGTFARNRVWRTEESLWLDDVQKSPNNGRGLMNYGLTLMARGAYAEALDYFQRALPFTPNYPTLEINLGIANGGLKRSYDAELHFLRAISLAPADDSTHYFYGRWLFHSGRVVDALHQLEIAVRLNPSKLAARDLLASAYSMAGDTRDAQATVAETLRLAPDDIEAKAALAQPVNQNADYWINASLYQYQGGHFDVCIEDAKQALRIKPDNELAYNNIGAAYAALKQWDKAIENERQALRIKPDFQLAKNNLALYTQARTGAALPPSANRTPEDWLNASLADEQAGQHQKCIEDAQQALKLRPEFAEAYSNMAAAYSSMHQWDKAISAAQMAIRIKPDFQLAKNNLAWALSQKQLGVR